MQRKSVTALRRAKTGLLRSNSTVIAALLVKRGKEVTLFSRHKKVLNNRFPGVVDALTLLGSDFVFDALHWIRKGDLHFSSCKITLSRALPVYFCAFDLLNRNGELLVDLSILSIERRRELLAKMRDDKKAAEVVRETSLKTK